MSDQTIPRHIGIILDGNRRWAKKYGLPAYEGHLAGHDRVQEVALAAFNSGVEFVSMYAFSTENWKRSQEEVDKLMGLVLKSLTSDVPIMNKNNIKLRVIGSRENLSNRIIKAIDSAEASTQNNTGGTLVLCFNYGGQLEIVDAVKKIIQSGVGADKVDTDLISRNIYGPEIPLIDIVVRTGGEHRISNFMLWRISYSELLFLDKFWPDMTKNDVKVIIDEYSNRSRRIGK
jgi:undecaprenyl diphosphate synthase